MKLGYVIKRAFSMDYKNFLAAARRVAKKTGRPSAAIFADMVRCGVKYRAGYADYELFEFYRLPHEKRRTYITRGVNNDLVARLNTMSHREIFDDKLLFNDSFREFLHRDYIDLNGKTPAQLQEFLRGKQRIFAKPQDGICGKGIEKIDPTDYTVGELFRYLMDKELMLLEEEASQHPDLSRIYPGSVNTIRVVSIGTGGRFTPVFASLRMGRGGSFVDNLNAGGLSALIDMDSGIIVKPGVDKHAALYDTHPDTGEKIVGAKIPMFKEALDMLKEASRVIPDINYVGWDVGISPETPFLIEANQFPGNDIIQLPAQLENGNGRLPQFMQVIKRLGL